MNGNEEEGIVSLINNLKITEIFEDKDKEEEASVMDFIN